MYVNRKYLDSAARYFESYLLSSTIIIHKFNITFFGENINYFFLLVLTAFSANYYFFPSIISKHITRQSISCVHYNDALNVLFVVWWCTRHPYSVHIQFCLLWFFSFEFFICVFHITNSCLFHEFEVKILCHLHHDQLRAVFHVSQRIRRAVSSSLCLSIQCACVAVLILS